MKYILMVMTIALFVTNLIVFSVLSIPLWFFVETVAVLKKVCVFSAVLTGVEVFIFGMANR